MKARLIHRSSALLASALVSMAAVAFLARPRPPMALPVPDLTNSRIIRWIDGRRVITEEYGTHCGREIILEAYRSEPYENWLDLQNGPGGDRFTEESDLGVFRSSPSPSPDGRWLLYQETQGYKHNSRFRLVPRAGGPSRYVPASKDFLSKSFWAWCWLPDSQGWIAFRRRRDASLEMVRYDLDRPDSPQLLTPL